MNDPLAKDIMIAWSTNSFLKSQKQIPEKIPLIIFKVPGRVTINDLSPKTYANTRDDIPLHSRYMLDIGLMQFLDHLKYNNFSGNNSAQICFVCDELTVDNESKYFGIDEIAIKSLLWNIGQDVPRNPGYRNRGIILANRINPQLHDILSETKSLVFETNVNELHMGNNVIMYPHHGIIRDFIDTRVISRFETNTETLLEVQAGGSNNLEMSRQLQSDAKQYMSAS